MAEEAVCSKLAEALRPLLERLGAGPGDVERLDIDYEGPRIIVKLKPRWAKTLYVDVSPDGVELALTLEAPRGLDPVEAEEALEEALEENNWVDTLEEYDIAYDPDTGEATVTLAARLLEHLPPAEKLAEELLRRLH